MYPRNPRQVLAEGFKVDIGHPRIRHAKGDRLELAPFDGHLDRQKLLREVSYEQAEDLQSMRGPIAGPPKTHLNRWLSKVLLSVC